MACRGLYVLDDLVHDCRGMRGYALHGVYSESMQFAPNAGQHTTIQWIDAIYTHMQDITPPYSGSMQFTPKCRATHHQLYSGSMQCAPNMHDSTPPIIQCIVIGFSDMQRLLSRQYRRRVTAACVQKPQLCASRSDWAQNGTRPSKTFRILRFNVGIGGRRSSIHYRPT